MKKFFTLLFAFFITGTAHAQLSFLDPSFGSGGIIITPPPMATVYSSGSFNSVVVQPDNKIIAAGAADEYIIVARYNENGTLDSTFAVNGIFSGGPVHSGLSAIVLQPDGKIVGVGSCDGVAVADGNLLTIRLNTDGSLDNTFGTGGMTATSFTISNDYGYAVALQPDGKILIAGSADDNYMGIARLLPNGILDSSFGTNGIYISSYRSQANGVAIMPDGRIIIGCEASSPVAFMAIRCWADGTLDTSFNHTGIAINNAGTGGFNYCHAMQLQSDNKIVLAGTGTFGTGSSDFTLIRYNTDGSLDRSFGDTGVVNIDFDASDDEASALYLESDGKIIVTGYSNARFGLARISSIGTIDSAFGNNGRITTTIQDGDDIPKGIAVQADNKIVLAGWSYNAARLGDDPTVARYMNTSVAVPQIINNENNLVFYPNPTTGILNIKGSINHIISITACDVLGNQIPVNTDLPNHKVFTSDIAPGIYFFKISSDDRPPDVQKIIIQNK